MKKLKKSSNKFVTRKDFLTNYSIFTLILLVIYGIGFFIATLGPYFDGLGIALDINSQISKTNQCSAFTSTSFDLFLAIAVPFIIFMLQFSFLHRKSSCYTTLSFNITRKNLFRNRLLLPLLFILFVTIAVKLYVLKSNINVFGYDTILIQAFFAHLFIYLRLIMFSSFCAIAASLVCGRFIEAFTAGASMFFLPSAISLCINILNEFFLFGATVYSKTILTTIAEALNPLDWSDEFYLYSYCYEGVFSYTKMPMESIIPSIVWIAVLSAGFVLLCKYFEKGYKPEKSGFKGTSVLASVFISITLPLTVALMFIEDMFYDYNYTYIESSHILYYAGIATLVLIVCALVCNLLVHFTFKKIKYALLSICVTLTFIGAVVGINSTDVFGTYNKIPDKEDIKKISLTLPYEILFSTQFTEGNVFDSYTLSGWEFSEFDTEKEIDLTLNLHRKILENRNPDTTVKATIVYTLKNGTEKEFEYYFLSDEAMEEALKFRESSVGEDYLRETLLPETVEYDDIDNYTNKVPVYKISMEQSDLIIEPYFSYENFNGSDISEQEFRALREAVFKDVMNISNDDWFYPSVKPLGHLTIYTYSYDINDSELYGVAMPFSTPVYETMTNTIKVLKSMGYYEELFTQAPIKEVYLGNLEDIILYETGTLVTGPIFCPDYSYDYYMDQPLTKITNKAECTKLLNSARSYYFVGSEKRGKVLIVVYDSEAQSIYYIP